jgi:hypothetical protein
MLDQLKELAETWGQPVSGVVRDAVKYVLLHPDMYAELLSARMAFTVDPRTEAQKAAWQSLEAELEAFDLVAALNPHA